jgi:hypothetical protein
VIAQRIRWTTCSAALIAVFGLIGLSGCAGVVTAPSTTPAASSGSVAAFLTDAPADGVAAFTIQLTGATLVGSNGVSTSISTGVQQIEIRHLALASTVALQTAGAPSGNYTALNLSFANPQMTLVDGSGNVTVLTATTTPSVTLANVTVNAPISMSLAPNGAAGLVMDFDLRQSISSDGSGNYVVTPVVNVSNVTGSSTEPNLENAQGTVVSVPSSNAVNLLLEDTGQVVRVTTNPSTLFSADAGTVTSVSSGQYIDVDAAFQNDGTFLASRVNTVSSNPAMCFSGVVSGVTTDGSGNTTLAVVVQE